jgi:hypothetical protein
MPGQAPARRMAKFSLRAELQFALGSGRRPKARPGLGKRRRTPAQWAAAAESTAACSMEDPGSRMSMDPPPLLYRLCVCSSNRGRGCTMQELRALSFGPQKYATPGTDFLRDAHVRPDRTCLHRRLQRPSWMHLASYMPYRNGPGSQVWYWHIVKKEGAP